MSGERPGDGSAGTARWLAGGQAEGAGERVAGVLALAVVEGRAVRRVNPGDPGEVADAGVAGEGFAAPQGDQRRVRDELAVRAVRCAGVDLLGAGAEGLVVRPADPVQGGQGVVRVGAGQDQARRAGLLLAGAADHYRAPRLGFGQRRWLGGPDTGWRAARQEAQGEQNDGEGGGMPAG